MRTTKLRVGSAREEESETPGGPPPGEAASDLHPRRPRPAILDVLEVAPGLNKTQVADRIGVSSELGVFHIDHLVDEGLLACFEGHRNNEIVCFRVEDAGLWEEPATRILYGHSATSKVASVPVRKGRTTSAQIADAVDRNRSSVRYHLRKLRDAGLVSSRKLGRSVSYVAEPRLDAWWREVGAGRAAELDL